MVCELAIAFLLAFQTAASPEPPGDEPPDDEEQAEPAPQRPQPPPRS